MAGMHAEPAAACTLLPLLLRRPALLGCYAITSPGGTASLQACKEIPLTRQTQEAQGRSHKVPSPLEVFSAGDRSGGGEGEEWRCKERHTHRRRSSRQNTHGEGERKGRGEKYKGTKGAVVCPLETWHRLLGSDTLPTAC